jgi:two-component system, LuxR family, sensor kinase FixL
MVKYPTAKHSPAKSVILNRKPQISPRSTCGEERARLKLKVADLSETRNQLRAEVRLQADTLKIKNGQIRKWAHKEKLAKEQIRIRAKAMDSTMRRRNLKIKKQREELLHVTRVGKLAEFVSSLAHEISQPLTAILSYAQAGQRILAGRDPQIQEILQYIINDDQRAVEVIRRLRSLLKKSDPKFEPLDINALINETVVLIMTDVTVRNKVIKTQLRPGLPLIRGDRIQLQQVLLNLLSNSLDAMDGRPDSREISIRTGLQDAATIIVQVKDSGCGIPLEDMPKLFHHFFTSKTYGLGMGLSISRSIVEAHGGRLEAENNHKGKGAVFYFTLPAGQGDLS